MTQITTQPTVAQLIKALGGPTAVARVINSQYGEDLTTQAVSHWRHSGIPSHRLVQLALARGRVLRSPMDIEPSNWHRLFPEVSQQVEQEDRSSMPPIVGGTTDNQ